MQKSYVKIAYETFNSCKDLLTNKVINKTEVTEKGKKVCYSLTNKGNQYVKLLLIADKTIQKEKISEEGERQMNLYLLLFLFRRPPTHICESEEEFTKLLSKNNLSENDLQRLVKGKENKNGKTIITTTFDSDSGVYIWKTETLEKKTISEVRTYVYH